MDEAAARLLLGVPATATPREIEAAFRARALSTHPDMGGEADLFRSAVEARRTLLESRQAPPVTVVPDVPLLRQLVTAILRFIDRPPPRMG